VVFALCGGKQLGNVVVTEALAQSEGAGIRPVRFSGWRFQDLIKADSKRGVNDLLKGPLQYRRAFLCFGSDIRIKRQRGSHLSIMMLLVVLINVGLRRQSPPVLLGEAPSP
jgi:hypothetical protein